MYWLFTNKLVFTKASNVHFKKERYLMLLIKLLLC